VSEGLFLNSAISYQQTRLQGTVTNFTQPGSKGITVMLLVFILVISAFLYETSYTRKLELQGHVDDRHIARISAQVDGRVSRLWVQEGEWIEKGSVVAEIAWGTKESIHTREQLLAELERQFIELSLEKSALIKLHEINIGKAGSQLVNLENRKDHFATMARLRNEAEEHSQERRRAAAVLKEQGHLTKTEWIQIEQNFLGERLQTLRITQEKSVLLQQIQETGQRLHELPAHHQQDLSRLAYRLSDLRQQKTRLLNNDHQQVLAPVDGEVSLVNINTGMEVSQGALMVAMIPDTVGLTATLYVPSFAHVYINNDRELELRLQHAIDEQAGFISGAVTHISNNPIIQSDQRGNNVPMFVARINLQDAVISTASRQIPLKSGMALTCAVRLETYSLLEWLFHPIRALNGMT